MTLHPDERMKEVLRFAAARGVGDTKIIGDGRQLALVMGLALRKVRLRPVIAKTAITPPAWLVSMMRIPARVLAVPGTELAS